jgi:YebC/PmpR family DNA-binding regulatory protein
MAGHSKWANTKHRKAAQDSKRGKIFTKIIRELVTAAKLGGGDPAANPRLRAAIDKALSNNMTRDTLNRAVARGVGGDDDTNMETIIYEGYGPGGSAVMVECLSDNRNRTVAEVRHAFNKTGGNLGTDGSVSYLFSKKGVISFAPGLDEDVVMEAALEAGAEDIVSYDDGAIDVFTAWESLGDVKDALEAAGFKADSAEVTMIPSTKADMDADTAPKLLRLIDMLEDCDDVQEVYHNGEISDEIAGGFHRLAILLSRSSLYSPHFLIKTTIQGVERLWLLFWGSTPVRVLPAMALSARQGVS